VGGDDAVSDDMFDETSHEFVEGLVPVGAAATWDACAKHAPQPMASWAEQDRTTQAVFLAAFTAGLEAMAAAAEGEAIR
jgi:hypothetical protein